MTNRLFQFGVLTMVLGFFVVLTLKDKDVTVFVSVVTPILAAVFVVGEVSRRSDKQDEALAQITHQTNGVLTERINQAVADGVKAALTQSEDTHTE